MGEEKNCSCDAVRELQMEIKNINERLGRGSTNFRLLEREYGEIKEDIKTILSDIKELKEKPSKRYDHVVTQIINISLGILLAYIAVQIGL